MGGPNKGNHSKTAVNNFRFEPLILLSLTHLAPAASLPSGQHTWPACSIEGLIPVGKLHNSNGQKSLNVGSESYRRNSLKWVGGGICRTGEVRKVLLPHHTHNGEHANTSMFQFGPAGVTQIGLNVREAHGIEAHIAGHGSVELFGDGEEGDGLGHRTEFQGGASLRVR